MNRQDMAAALMELKLIGYHTKDLQAVMERIDFFMHELKKDEENITVDFDELARRAGV